jgi:hypothetical protein
MKQNQNGYYITEDNPTIKVPIKPQNEISLNGMKIIELILPRCKQVHCFGNKLTKLVIPEGCEEVDCTDNQLTELIIPMGCKRVNCNRNKINKLIVSKSCETVLFVYNRLHPIIENLLGSKDPVKIALANNLQLANSLQR